MPRRIRFILFCDQVRSEASSKNIYIGTYGSAMIVEGSFPAVLPSFAIAIAVDPPPVDAQGGLADEEIKFQFQVPGVEQSETKSQVIKRKHPLDSYFLHLSFVPFVIPQPGEVSVSISLEDGETAEASLLVIERDEYAKTRRH